jgi:alpha-maltose-1-phosphate synthase
MKHREGLAKGRGSCYGNCSEVGIAPLGSGLVGVRRWLRWAVRDPKASRSMRIAILTNEYPPHIYGGAGVHVEYLTRELTRLDNGEHTVLVLAFGEQSLQAGNLTVQGVQADFTLPYQDSRHQKFMDTLARDLLMAGSLLVIDVIHCHTWYTHLAGCLARQLTGAPLVLTTHSLEPHRPWKVEQLGSAYQASLWIERTAYQNADGVIAVSEAMRADVQTLYGVPHQRVRVIHNGIDLDQYKPTPDGAILARHGIDAEQPYILFVGRITRQKGIIHLVHAVPHLHPGTQVVLCAGAPDTAEIGQEMAEAVEEARRRTDNPLIWIARMLPKDEIIPLYSQAALFVCPSVYEPFGIINLEAMACGTAVVASAVGGIKEVVVPEETGLLVPFEPRGEADFEPRDPQGFAHDLAAAINRLLANPERCRQMGRLARERVERSFGWPSIARQTFDFYREVGERRMTK